MITSLKTKFFTVSYICLAITLGGASFAFAQEKTQSPVAPQKDAGPLPEVARSWPTAGPPGQYITLEGAHFGFAPGEVTFVQRGVPFPADVSFPEECQPLYWRDGAVIIKVPQGLVAGKYTLRMRRGDGAKSNEIPFSITSGMPSPGVCGMLPDNGSPGVTTTLYGAGFGDAVSRVTLGLSEFSVTQEGWTDTKIIATSPKTGLVSGKLRVISANRVLSNPSLFSLSRCSPNSCGTGQACCSDGSCRPKGLCSDTPTICSYSWSFYTGARSKVGEACATNESCVSGVCGADKRCIRGSKEAGSQCTYDGECTEGLSCSQGRCREAYESIGEACSAHIECESSRCVEGYCAAGNLAFGARCQLDGQCQSGNCNEGKCSQELQCLTILRQEPGSGKVHENSLFRVLFNQKIDPLSTEGQIRLEPPTKGSFEFRSVDSGQNEKTEVIFRPERALSRSLSYQLIVGEGVKSFSSENTYGYCSESGSDLCSESGQVCSADNIVCSNGARCTGEGNICSGAGTMCEGEGSLCIDGARCTGSGSTCVGKGSVCTDFGSECRSGATCEGPSSKCRLTGTTCTGEWSVCSEGARCTGKPPIQPPQQCLDKNKICQAQGSTCAKGALCKGTDSKCTGTGTNCKGNGSECTNGAICDGSKSICSGKGTLCDGSESECLDGATCTGADSKCSGAQAICTGIDSDCTDGAHCPEDNGGTFTDDDRTYTPIECGIGTTRCLDGSCRASCPPELLLTCNNNKVCDLTESCTCGDCNNKQNSCTEGAACLPTTGVCESIEGWVPHGGCPEGSLRCSDGVCREDCGPNKWPPEKPDGICDTAESCNARDCNGKQDSCAQGLACNITSKVCDPIVEPPPCGQGHTLCSDGYCRASCPKENNDGDAVCDVNEGCVVAACAGTIGSCEYGYACSAQTKKCEIVSCKAQENVCYTDHGVAYCARDCDQAQEGDTESGTDAGLPCGNGKVETGEVCDGTDLRGKTCQNLSIGYTGGSLFCNDACELLTNFCEEGSGGNPVCGNGKAETGEWCDQKDLRGKTCTSLGVGYTGGTLGCSEYCDYDDSTCTYPGQKDSENTVTPAIAKIVVQVNGSVATKDSFTCVGEGCDDDENMWLPGNQHLYEIEVIDVLNEISDDIGSIEWSVEGAVGTVQELYDGSVGSTRIDTGAEKRVFVTGGSAKSTGAIKILAKNKTGKLAVSAEIPLKIEPQTDSEDKTKTLLPIDFIAISQNNASDPIEIDIFDCAKKTGCANDIGSSDGNQRQYRVRPFSVDASGTAQEIAWTAAQWKWSVQGDTIGITAGATSSVVEITPISKNGMSSLSVVGQNGDTALDASIAITNELCDVSWELTHTTILNYGVSLKYCQGNTQELRYPGLDIFELSGSDLGAFQKGFILRPSAAGATQGTCSDTAECTPGYVCETGTRTCVRNTDAIILRIASNPNFQSAYDWYTAQPSLKQGSPRSTLANGLPAVQDSYGIYVSAGSVALADKKLTPYIFHLSYNTNANPQTIQLFEKIVESIDFVRQVSYNPSQETELSDTNFGAQVRRDIIRLGDLERMKRILTSKNPPTLETGTYLKGKTISVWPSWYGRLSNDLGVALPLDPYQTVSKMPPLGNCNNNCTDDGSCKDGYERSTCWSESKKSFAFGASTLEAIGYVSNGKWVSRTVSYKDESNISHSRPTLGYSYTITDQGKWEVCANLEYLTGNALEDHIACKRNF